MNSTDIENPSPGEAKVTLDQENTVAHISLLKVCPLSLKMEVLLKRVRPGHFGLI